MLRLAADNVRTPVADAGRRAALAKVHLAKKALGMVDDDYRALLQRVTGHASAAGCDRRQLAALLAEFERMGFRGAAPARSRAAGPVPGKARALWISLHQLGAIDNPSEAALEAFGRRQLGVDRLQWSSGRDGFRLIEALKAMATRAGWDQRVPARMSSRDQVRLLKDRLVGAQLARLAAAGVVVDGPIAADRAGWSDRQLESAARDLAGRLRETGAA